MTNSISTDLLQLVEAVSLDRQPEGDNTAAHILKRHVPLRVDIVKG